MCKNKFHFYSLTTFLILLLMSCSSSDGDGDSVLDTVTPTIDCPDTITANTVTDHAVVDYMTPFGADNVSATTTQTEGLAPGELFPVGTTTNTFQATDAAGNSISCSFDVIVIKELPSADQPFIIEGNPTPTGKTWEAVAELTDEFEGTSIDESKWHTEPRTHPHLTWPGRVPGLFQSKNVKTKDGEMIIEVGKLPEPITISPYGKPLTYTFYGGILRSLATSTVGNYYECRMKMNKTEMGGGFWLNGFNRECGKKHEIDITESVGHITDATAQWAKTQGWDQIFHSNSIRREDMCDSGQERDSDFITLPTKNHERYYIYGFWWKSPTELLFYLDGEYQYTLTPPVPFDQQGYLQFSIESYDWNPIAENGSKVETMTLEERTTHVDYIRVFKVVD